MTLITPKIKESTGTPTKNSAAILKPVDTPSVHDIFTKIKSVFVWTSDKELFGVNDKIADIWPNVDRGEFPVRGDCDDFAFACARGIDERTSVSSKDIGFALCEVPQGGMHCVCLVRGTSHNYLDWLVLDNTQNKVSTVYHHIQMGFLWIAYKMNDMPRLVQCLHWNE